MRRPSRLRPMAIVPRDPIERELQHNFGRTRRPSPLAFYIHMVLEEAADVDQQSGEFRSSGIERLMHPLSRGDHRFGEGAGASPTAAGRYRAGPVRCRARHEVSPGEIRAQPLARLQLLRLDQGAAVTAAAARQLRQRAFRLVDRDSGAAVFRRDLSLRHIEVLAAK
jgi:hypothetical protein